MEKSRAERINQSIEQIKKHIDEISTLGWDIVNEFQDEYNPDNYELDVIEDADERSVFQIAQNCALIDGWNEFMFGSLQLPTK